MNSYVLFARPNFITGIAQIMDFGNTLFIYNDSRTTEEADCRALASDWRAVGDDLRHAIEEVASTTEELRQLAR